MERNSLGLLLFIKKATTIGLLLGVLVFVSSFFVSGITGDYLLHIGISFVASSMMIFGFGLFINVMGDVVAKEKI